MRSRAAVHTVRNLALLAAGCAAVFAADLLPITDPATAWAADVSAGCFAVLAATTWLPCPCHRKDPHQ